MARRQTDEIVDQIRLKRHRLARAAGLSDLVAGTVQHARQHPVLWIVGGTALGAVSVRFLLPALAGMSRGIASRWIRSTVQGGVLSLAQGVLWSFWPSGAPDEVSAEWEDATFAEEDAPLQATGGSVQPLSSH